MNEETAVHNLQASAYRLRQRVDLTCEINGQKIEVGSFVNQTEQ